MNILHEQIKQIGKHCNHKFIDNKITEFLLIDSFFVGLRSELFLLRRGRRAVEQVHLDRGTCLDYIFFKTAIKMQQLRRPCLSLSPSVQRWGWLGHRDASDVPNIMLLSEDCNIYSNNITKIYLEI